MYVIRNDQRKLTHTFQTAKSKNRTARPFRLYFSISANFIDRCTLYSETSIKWTAMGN